MNLLENNPDDVIKTLHDDIKHVSYNDITDDVINTMNLNIVNKYIEYLADYIIEHKFLDNNAVKCSHDKLYTILIYYHPKLFEYVFAGYTIDEFNKHRTNMLVACNELIEQHKELTTEHYERLVNVKRLLEIQPHNDISTMTAFEYGFYFTWASFKRGFVDISQDVLKQKNTFDILAINVLWNNQYEDSVVMYNDITDINIPVLTDAMVAKTKRIHRYPITNTPKGPISLYDKDFHHIDKLTTEKVCVVFDYGNNYYTKLFIGNDEITLKFANSIVDRNIIPNYNKRLLHSIIDRDVFMFLPTSCYNQKQEQQLLLTNINKIKKIVMDSFTPNIATTINNIMQHSLITDVLPNQHDRLVFRVYLSYLYTMDSIDLNTVIDIVQSYIYDKNITQLQV